VRIIASGIRFFPYPHAGDKTFWLNLLRRMTVQGDEVHVVNVDRRPRPTETVVPGLTIETIPAVAVNWTEGMQVGRYNAESVDIASITNYASKTATLRRLFACIRDRSRAFRPDAIHFMDNLGPFVWPYARSLPRPNFASAITYDPRSPVYDLLLRASLSGFDGVAASSDTFRDRLIRARIPADRIRTIPWGADPPGPRSDEERARAKTLLGPASGCPVVMWAGFIQQITEPDFRLAYRVAREARRLVPDLETWFCFKPQHFRAEYEALAAPGVHLTGDPERFHQVRAAADLFLNPVTRVRSILAPPLTWVEVMQAGIPVLTTRTPGASECLGEGRAGEAIPQDQLLARLTQLTTDLPTLRALGRGARDWASDRYSLARSASSFRELWSAG
jgi:glycosyltransferase involved in cell wall biosynthesis